MLIVKHKANVVYFTVNSKFHTGFYFVRGDTYSCRGLGIQPPDAEGCMHDYICYTEYNFTAGS